MPIKIKNIDKDQKIKYKKLDPFLLQPPFRMLLVGPSGSGKSNLMVNIMNKKNGYGNVFRKQDIILFSSTLGLDDKLSFIKYKSENAFKEFDPQIVKDVMMQQRAIKINMGKKRMPNVLIIFDDMASQGIFNNNGLMLEMAFQSRHLNISWIITTQKYSSVGTALRRNVSVVYIFEPRNLAELDQIIDENADRVRKKKFRQILLQLYEEPYAFLTINYEKGYPKFIKNLDEPFTIEE